ncbi:MAG: YfbU family protein [Balneola sp.]
MNLDEKDRLMLYNQFKILQELYPSEATSYERFCHILESGFKKHYSDFYDWFSDELPDEVADKVFDVLSMFRKVHDSIQNLSQRDQQNLDKTTLRFRGFDLNNEGKHYSYSVFLIEKDNRYHESKLSYYNSHTPMLTQYEQMIDFVNGIQDRYLTLAQLQELSNI